MNEKIKQLALKSGFAYEPTKDQLWVSGPNEVMISPGLKKFAELIAKECAAICLDTAEKRLKLLDFSRMLYPKIKI